MTVYKAEISVSGEDAEQLVSLLSEMLDPPPAISTHEKADGWLVELYFDERPDGDALALIADNLADPATLRDLQLTTLADENWVEKTQQGLHPVRAGRFFIHGSHDRAAAASHPYSIEIDAGQAFGTAHHGTTRGCLEMIDRLARFMHAPRVLDLGTGSGILAIAAAKSLSRGVLAADIDPIAVDVAAQNFRLNRVNGRVVARCASNPCERTILARAPFQLIIANILAGPLISLAPAIRQIAARRSHLILSGLLDHQAQAVIAQYLAQGFEARARLSLEGWTTLLMQYRARFTQ